MHTRPEIDLDAAREAVRRALDEDLGSGDLTSEAVVPADARARGWIVAREPGVAAGLPLVRLVFEEVAARTRGAAAPDFEAAAGDGESFRAGDRLALVAGPARMVLAGERTALNFVQRLSGIATLARRFTEAIAGTKAAIFDTRKTTPGLRSLEKYAVRAGGARNHRMGLHDQALVKDNHLAVLAARAGVAPDELDLRPVVAQVRAARPGAFVEVEVTTLRGVERALEAAPDAILLDNMDLETLARAVALVRERTPAHARPPALEASGGVRLDRVREIAETGVDRISAGSITHGARSLDIALDFETT